MAGKSVSQTECAVIFGVHRNTVGAWLSKGCPHIQKANKPQGKDWVLNTAEVAQWRESQAVSNATGDLTLVDAEELKLRKLAAETVLAEIITAERRGQVAEIATMEKIWRDYMIEFRTRVMQLPSRISSLLLGLNDEREIKEVLRVELREALTVLSETRLDENEVKT